MLLFHLEYSILIALTIICICITTVVHFRSPDCFYHTVISNFNQDFSIQNFLKKCSYNGIIHIVIAAVLWHKVMTMYVSISMKIIQATSMYWVPTKCQLLFESL